MSTAICPICTNPDAAELPSTFDGCICKCPRCGEFSVTGTAAAVWEASKPTARQIANASGWIRKRQGLRITSDDIDYLLGLETPTVEERADRLFLELFKRFPDIGTQVGINCSEPQYLGAEIYQRQVGV